ncbi:MAG: DUF551 domain-containing protein [Citrobacter freundii]|nr:DUF551 domain-containing protein [Citrobacter freundii]MDU4808389.1 DUF551 domain-containing protein [Citrobacter freundii]
MSTITKELAKLFRKITNSEIDAEGNAHVVLSPADSLLINNARIALASLEAEAVACIDRANLDYLESGADADVWPASGAGSDDVLLYAAPQLPQPAVLSVPDEIPKLKDGMGFKYVKDGVRYSLNYANGWNACRAAMLQAGNHTEKHLDMVDHSGDANKMVAGNSPVTPDRWIPVSERMPPNKPGSYEYIVFDSLNNKAHHDYWNVPDGSCDDFSPFWNHYGKYVTHWMPLPAAPQQEVKNV